jgi:hypothetical protein
MIVRTAMVSQVVITAGSRATGWGDPADRAGAGAAASSSTATTTTAMGIRMILGMSCPPRLLVVEVATGGRAAHGLARSGSGPVVVVIGDLAPAVGDEPAG